MLIEDYALIGDTQTAALVGRDGSIDWLCLPRFDSGAVFARLLGDESNGRWRLAPAGDVLATRRRYRPGTLVLETEYDTAEGTVRVTDCMPIRQSHADVVRVVEGVSGRVPMVMDLVIRFDYGSTVPWVRRVDGTLQAVAGPDLLSLRTPVPVHGENLTTVAEFSVAAGERVPFHLMWHESWEPAPECGDPLVAVEETDAWWSRWAARSTYDGPWPELVQRSLLTLKALTYAPTGGIVAAPTTSLPEQLGGVRNWDYRYCWLRDAAFTLQSLMSAGYTEEAVAWRDWLLRAVAGDPAQLQVLYGPAGERRIPELELTWLAGYEGAQPVRVGNAAVGQFQLDVYGEVLDALHQGRSSGIPASAPSWSVQRVLLDFLEGAWRHPDEGIWEVRGPRRHFTHSKVMAWTALDRAVQAVERFGHDGPVDRWRALRAEVHREVCEQGYDAERNTFTQYYGGTGTDASLLLIGHSGFLPPDDPRLVGTVAAVERELLSDGLVVRYRDDADDVDGLPPGEGAFLACSFWLADVYVMQGRRAEAGALFQRLAGLANDLGLLAEEYDVTARRLVGNFPQAFSHVALVNTALHLSRAGHGGGT